MVKIIFIFFLSALLFADDFEKNCLVCHGDDFKFNIIMKKYTLKYSSEKKIKKAMFYYLKEPKEQNSILPYEYIKKFGIKEKSPLSEEELKKMIDIYYQKYNLKSKIY